MTSLIEVYRNSVRTWECDEMGHMNIQFYVDKATGALDVLGRMLGLPAPSPNNAGLHLVAKEHHIRFLREQLAGAPICIHAGVLEVSDSHLNVYFEMRNPAAWQVAATLVARVELVDHARTHPLPMPPEVLKRARAMQTDLPDYAAPRGLELTKPREPITLQQANELGMVATYLTPLEPQLVDSDGFMTTRAYIGAISDSIPNFAARLGKWDRSTSRIGGAALEYRLVYYQAPRKGTILAVRSAIRHVGAKAYTFCHWLFDNDTGKTVAAAEAVAVMFDLDARKAITIPDDRRAALEKLLIPGLGI